MNQAAILAAAGLAVGGLSGFFIGKSSGESGKKPDVVAEARLNRGGGLGVQFRAEGENPAKKQSQDLGKVLSMPGQRARFQGLVERFDNLALAEFKAEAEKIAKMPRMSTERMLSSFLLFSKWGEVAPQEALAFSDSMDRGPGYFARPLIFQGWAATDPVNAAAFLKEHGAGEEFMVRNSAGEIAKEWARLDPEAALKWASSLTNGKDSATQRIFDQLGEKDPKKALALLSSLESSQRGNAIESIARAWSSTDWNATSAWINSLPTSERDKAFSSALDSLANNDPQLAKKEVEGMPPGAAKNAAIQSIAGDIARKNPQEAAAWVTANSASEEVKTAGIQDVMRYWGRQDSVSALAWINNQPVGNVRDAATRAYLRNSSEKDNSSKMNIALSIQDESQRNEALVTTALRWIRSDKNEATLWLQNNQTISPQIKDGIIKASELQRSRGEGGSRGGRYNRGF